MGSPGEERRDETAYVVKRGLKMTSGRTLSISRAILMQGSAPVHRASCRVKTVPQHRKASGKPDIQWHAVSNKQLHHCLSVNNEAVRPLKLLSPQQDTMTGLGQACGSKCGRRSGRLACQGVASLLYACTVKAVSGSQQSLEAKGRRYI